MKILVLGNTNSIWSVNYISNVLINSDDEIWISSGDVISNEFLSIYKKMNVHILNTSKTIKILGKQVNGCEANRLINTVSSIIKQQDFDVIHMHYVSRTYLIAFYITRKHFSRSVATFWGSDLLRHDEKYFNLYGNIIRCFNKISVATNTMKNDLLRKMKAIDNEKISIVQFGISTIDSISALTNKSNKITCRESLSIPTDKYTIAIGYNRSKAQHHKEVIESLLNLPNDIKNQICVVLQMTYGPKDDEYISTLLSLLDKNEISYRIFNDYMTQEQTSMLRLSVDCFINAQETDALSATMIEYLFAGAIIINSANLKYEELNEYVSRIYEFDDYRDIVDIICSCRCKENMIDKNMKNRIMNQFCWNNLYYKWRQLYDIKE